MSRKYAPTRLEKRDSSRFQSNHQRGYFWRKSSIKDRKPRIDDDDFTGHYPRGAFEFIEGVLRWTNRVSGYAFTLVTDAYPPFQLAA
jgi:hypothetical protein